MDSLLSFVRASCLHVAPYRQVGPIRVTKGTELTLWDNELDNRPLTTTAKTTKPSPSESLRQRRFSNASAKDVIAFLQFVEMTTGVIDSGILPLNPMSLVYLQPKGDMSSIRISKSALLTIFAQSLSGVTISGEELEMGDGLRGVLSRAISEFMGLSSKLSLLHRLMSVELLTSYSIGIFDIMSEGLEESAPVLVDLCKCFETNSMYMQSTEAKNVTNIWTQITIKFMRIWYPLLYFGAGSMNLRFLSSAFHNLAPCVRIASHICNEKMGLMLTFWY